MAINDDNIGWNRVRRYIPFRSMAGILEDATSGIPASLGTGTPLFTEVPNGAAELAGLSVAADADEVYEFLPILSDMDLTNPVRFRLWFIHGSTDADTPIFSLAIKGIGKQAAITDAKSSPDLTVTFDTHTCSTTDNSLEITNWNEADLLANSIVLTDFALLMALTCSTMAASADEIVLLGLEIDYRNAAAPNVKRQDTLGAPVSNTTPSG